MMKLPIILLVASLANGFAPKAPLANHHHHAATSSTTTSRFVVDPSAFPMDNDAVTQLHSLSVQEIKEARAAFLLCFFGAAGTASLGREVIPNTWNQWTSTQKLLGSGKGSGGPEMNLFGYPEPVYVNDVMTVLNNNMTATDIEQNFPGKYPGYLQFDSLMEANPEVAPMAVRAVFDSLSIGINKNQIISGKADRIFDLYRNDFATMEKNIKLGKTIGVAAFVILLGLLGAADYFALFHLLRGWFPDWEGFSDLPFSILDERGFSNLLNCFVGDEDMYS